MRGENVFAMGGASARDAACTSDTTELRRDYAYRDFRDKDTRSRSATEPQDHPTGFGSLKRNSPCRRPAGKQREHAPRPLNRCATSDRPPRANSTPWPAAR
jgi:hypothetical protein